MISLANLFIYFCSLTSCLFDILYTTLKFTSYLFIPPTYNFGARVILVFYLIHLAIPKFIEEKKIYLGMTI